MKQLIVFSDAHGRKEVFDFLKEKYPNSPKIYLGDSQFTKSDMEEYTNDFMYVLGNCDYNYHIKTKTYKDIIIEYRSTNEATPEEMVFTYEGVHFIACHGHHLYEDDFLYLNAWKADCLLQGHTHVFKNEQENGKYSINPGSCNPLKVREINKDWTRKPSSYCVINIENNKIQTIERIDCDQI